MVVLRVALHPLVLYVASRDTHWHQMIHPEMFEHLHYIVHEEPKKAIG